MINFHLLAVFYSGHIFFCRRRAQARERTDAINYRTLLCVLTLFFCISLRPAAAVSAFLQSSGASRNWKSGLPARVHHISLGEFAKAIWFAFAVTGSKKRTSVNESPAHSHSLHLQSADEQTSGLIVERTHALHLTFASTLHARNSSSGILFHACTCFLQALLCFGARAKGKNCSYFVCVRMFYFAHQSLSSD